MNISHQVLKQTPRLNPHTKKLQPVNNNKTTSGNSSSTLPSSNNSLWNTQNTSAGTFQDAPFFVPQFNDDGLDEEDAVVSKGVMSTSMSASMAGKGSVKTKRALTPFDDEV